MPLFAHTDTHIVTYRPYEFNTEYLDGILELLKDDEVCHIVTHHPNKRFGYDVGIIKTLYADTGWEEVEKLGHFNPDNPAQVYYELIPQKYYDEYINKENFYFSKKFKVPSEPEVEKSKVIKDQFEIPSKRQSIINPQPMLNIKEPRLVRGTEKAIYTYRKPNQRYGLNT